MSPHESRSTSFSPSDGERLALSLYGMTCKAKPLPGYMDCNFLLREEGGERHVLKISSVHESQASLDFQNQALEHLAGQPQGPACPRVCKSLRGETMTAVESREGNKHFLRLLTFLPGPFLADHAPLAPDLLFDLGSFLGRLDLALRDFMHPAMHRAWAWDLKRAASLREYLPLLPTWRQRNLVDHFLTLFERRALPAMAGLRTSVIHNDGNEYNLLVSEGTQGSPRIAGIIDFGDMVHTCTVCEPAIAATYAAMGQADPLAAAARVVAGYHKVHPLEERELEVIFPLMGARLCTSVCLSALQQQQDPDNDYLAVSREGAFSLLEHLVGRDPAQGHDLFRQACGFPPLLAAHGGLAREELLRLRANHIGPSLSVSYERPLKIVRGFMQYLYDDQGRPYLDGVNNVPHVGHCHPRVVRAAADQMASLNTNTRYLHDHLVRYARRLCRTLPDPLSICFFVNSGSEANDLALRLAHAHTGGQEVIVVDGAYHGNLSTLIDISPYKFDGPGGSGSPPHVHITPMPDGYRGPIHYSDPEGGAHYAAHLQELCQDMKAEGRPLCAFICESILGCGGQVVLPPGYLQAALRHIHEAGGLYIADEVQVGFGRVGSHFWAFETQGVIPDIVTLGKPMGNGHPMAAVITRPEIAASLDQGMEYFNTFGGNPVSCAVGMAVLDVIASEGLQENALKTGAHLKAGLEALMGKHEIMGDVRGLGLFLGVELVQDRKILAPARREAAAIAEAMKDEGILISTDGPFHNVLKIKPPLVFDTADADHLVHTLDRVLAALSL